MRQKTALLAVAAAMCFGGGAAVAADLDNAPAAQPAPVAMPAPAPKPPSLGDRFSYFGIFGNRYDRMDGEGVTDKSCVFILNTFFKVNEHITMVTGNELHEMYHGTSENWNNNGTGTVSIPSLGTFKVPDGYSDWQHLGLQIYADAKFDFAKLNVKAGRFGYLPAYGITHGDYLEVSGAQVSFGDTVRATLTSGQNTMYVPQGTYASMGYQAAELAWAADPKLNVKVSYQRNQSNMGLAPAIAYATGAPHNQDYISYFEGGFDARLPFGLSTEAAYVKSGYETNDKGYYAQLKYKNAIPFVPQTFDVYLGFHYLEANSIMYNDLRYYPNMKGARLGFHYTPMDSVLVTAWYDMQKYIEAGTSSPTGAMPVLSGQKDNFFRVQVDIFFK